MPTLGKGGTGSVKGVKDRGGYHTRPDMAKIHSPTFARDDLKGAFAGDENKNHADHGSSTNVKSRKTEASKTRTPKR